MKTGSRKLLLSQSSAGFVPLNLFDVILVFSQALDRFSQSLISCLPSLSASNTPTFHQFIFKFLRCVFGLSFFSVCVPVVIRWFSLFSILSVLSFFSPPHSIFKQSQARSALLPAEITILILSSHFRKENRFYRGC